MVHVIKPPTPLTNIDVSRTVFLAGSIEMGTAEDWQTQVTQSLTNTNLTLLNPRRDRWDPTWKQTITNPQFRAQVEWELDAQTQATMIVMYFAPSTQSPITLLELGLFANSDKLSPHCPDARIRQDSTR
ncbi:MAG: nucleoside 2-deoxyribosyltransferase domain-containing protein [Cyanobacteria bacterium J06628_4]